MASDFLLRGIAPHGTLVVIPIDPLKEPLKARMNQPSLCLKEKTWTSGTSFCHGAPLTWTIFRRREGGGGGGRGQVRSK